MPDTYTIESKDEEGLNTLPKTERTKTGITDEENDLLIAVAKHNPYSVRSIYEVYVMFGRSIDLINEAIEYDKKHSVGLLESAHEVYMRY